MGFLKFFFVIEDDWQLYDSLNILYYPTIRIEIEILCVVYRYF